MLWSLVASFAVSSQAALCQTNAAGSGCETPTASSCVTTCSLYKNQGPCLTIPGCNWTAATMFGSTVNICSPVNSSVSCGSAPDESACTANNTMCSWRTVDCKYEIACKSSNLTSPCFTVDGISDAACTGQGPACSMKGECGPSDRCAILTDQTGCTESAGCYWSSAVVNVLGITTNPSMCNLCFNDPSNTGNSFQTALSHVGQTCTSTMLGTTSTTKFSSAVAASGCTGGSAVADGMVCTNNPSTDSGATTLSSPLSSPSFAVALVLMITVFMG